MLSKIKKPVLSLPVGAPQLRVSPAALDRAAQLLSLPPDRFIVEMKSHSLVRACNDILRHRYHMLCRSIVRGTWLLLVGPSVKEIKEALTIEGILGVIAVFGDDPYDLDRAAPTSSSDTLDMGRYNMLRLGSGGRDVRVGNVVFTHAARLEECLAGLDSPVGGVASDCSAVSEDPSATADRIWLACRHNLGLGCDWNIPYIDLRPMPEELTHIYDALATGPFNPAKFLCPDPTGQTIVNEAYGYQLVTMPTDKTVELADLPTDGVRLSRRRVAFRPTDDNVTFERQYVEDHEYWLSHFDRACVGSAGLGVVWAEDSRMGVMLLRVGRVRWEGVYQNQPNARETLFTVPHLIPGMFLNEISLITVPRASAWEAADRLYSYIDKAVFTSTTGVYTDLVSSAAAYEQYMTGRTLNKQIIKNGMAQYVDIERVPHYKSTDVFKAACMIAYLRWLALRDRTLFSSITSMFGSVYNLFFGEIGRQDWIDIFNCTRPEQLDLRPVGSRKLYRFGTLGVPGGLAELLRVPVDGCVPRTLFTRYKIVVPDDEFVTADPMALVNRLNATFERYQHSDRVRLIDGHELVREAFASDIAGAMAAPVQAVKTLSNTLLAPGMDLVSYRGAGSGMHLRSRGPVGCNAGDVLTAEILAALAPVHVVDVPIMAGLAAAPFFFHGPVVRQHAERVSVKNWRKNGFYVAAMMRACGPLRAFVYCGCASGGGIKAIEEYMHMPVEERPDGLYLIDTVLYGDVLSRAADAHARGANVWCFSSIENYHAGVFAVNSSPVFMRAADKALPPFMCRDNGAVAMSPAIKSVFEELFPEDLMQLWYNDLGSAHRSHYRRLGFTPDNLNPVNFTGNVVDSACYDAPRYDLGGGVVVEQGDTYVGEVPPPYAGGPTGGVVAPRRGFVFVFYTERANIGRAVFNPAMRYREFWLRDFDLPRHLNDQVHSVPTQLVDETDAAYTMRLGAILHAAMRDGRPAAFREARVGARAAVPYWLYDDAATAREDIPYQRLHQHAECWLKKVRFSLPQAQAYISMRPGVRLFTKVPASNTEYNVGVIPAGPWDRFDVESNGIPAHIDGAGNRTLDVSELCERILTTPAHGLCTGTTLCQFHTACYEVSSDFGIDAATNYIHLDGDEQPSDFGEFMGTRGAIDANSRLRKLEFEARVRDLEWYNHPVVQKYMFKLTRTDDENEARRNGEQPPAPYMHVLEGDPLVKLFAAGMVAIVTGAPGMGKTLMGRGMDTFCATPLAGMAKDQAAAGWYRVETFEVAVRTLRRLEAAGPLKFKKLLLDEYQTFGPLSVWFQDFALRHGLKLVIMAGLEQSPWVEYAFTPEEAEEVGKAAIYAMKHAVSAETIASYTHSDCNTSFRFNDRTGKLLSRIAGRRIVGRNPNVGVELFPCRNLDEAISSCPHPEETIIVPTNDCAKYVSSRYPGHTVITATRSGGRTIATYTAFLFPHRDPLPYKIRIGEREIDFASFMACSRGGGKIYADFAALGIESNNINNFHIEEHAAPPALNRLRTAPRGRVIRGIGAPVYVVTEQPSAFRAAAEREGYRVTHGKADFVMPGSAFHLTARPPPDATRVVRFGRHAQQLLGRERHAVRQALAGENTLNGLVLRDEQELLKLAFPDPPDLLTRTLHKLRLADMSPQVKPLRELAAHHLDKFHLRREVLADRVTSGEKQGYASAFGNTILFGTAQPSLVYDGEKTAKFWGDIVDGEHVPAFMDFDMHTTTGQFHPQHLSVANDLVNSHFYPIPEVDGKYYHGRDVDLAGRLAAYHGQSFKIRMYGVYAAAKPVAGRYLGNGFLHYQQHPTAATTISTALDRYGPQNYKATVQAMPPGARARFLKEEQEHYMQILTVLGSLLKVSPMNDVDVRDLYVKHGIEFTVDQYSKGSMQLYPTLSDFLMWMWVMNQGMKKQNKFPSGLAYPYGNKGGQPVVTTRAGWMYMIAGHMRVLTEMMHSIMGPQIQIMGPNWSIDQLVAKLGPLMDFARLMGFDVKKCDSSHRDSFIFAMRALLIKHFPNVSASWFDYVLGFVYNCMSEWVTRTRDGSFSATVWGQLASGMAWTFFWNCMWSIYNCTSLVIKTVGFDAAKRMSPFMIIAAAGDDGFLNYRRSFPELYKKISVDGEFESALGAVLKIEVRSGAVEFCHMSVMQPHGGVGPSAHLDLVRCLGKLLTRGVVKDIEEFDEMKAATFALVKRYRDPRQLASCAHALAFVHHYQHSHTVLACDLLLRFCNTPSKKLFAMTRTVIAVPVEFA